MGVRKVTVAATQMACSSAQRASSGFFRDRRTDLYRCLLTLDGG